MAPRACRLWFRRLADIWNSGVVFFRSAGAYLVGADFARYVLELDLPQRIGLDIDLVGDLVVYFLGDADAARFARCLKPRSDVDTLAERVVFQKVDVSQVYTNANAEPLSPSRCVVRCDLTLDVDCTARCIQSRSEVSEVGVTDCFDHLATVGSDLILDQPIMVFEHLESAGFVLLQHATEATDVRVHDCGEPVVFCLHLLKIVCAGGGVKMVAAMNAGNPAGVVGSRLHSGPDCANLRIEEHIL